MILVWAVCQSIYVMACGLCKLLIRGPLYYKTNFVKIPFNNIAIFTSIIALIIIIIDIIIITVIITVIFHWSFNTECVWEWRWNLIALASVNFVFAWLTTVSPPKSEILRSIVSASWGINDRRTEVRQKTPTIVLKICLKSFQSFCKWRGIFEQFFNE